MTGPDRLEVETVGAGRPLVLIHSLLSDKSSFEGLVERLAGERRLVVVNLPGFGASPRGAATINGFADAVAGMIDDLGLPAATDVLGNGLGGFVTLSLAARHGGKFDRAVLVGSAVAFPEAGRTTFRMLVEKAEREGMAALSGAAIQRMFPEDFIAAEPALIAGRKTVFERIDPNVFAAAARALAALDFSDALPRIKNRVLIVVGEKDGATPSALARDLQARLPDADLIEMPGLGHCPHIQDPDAFVAAVAPFLGLASRSG
jgi:3-oxoadipate enol-lactonase